MKFFIHVFVLLQTIILAYFAYVSPYYGFTDLNGEQLIGLTILSVFMQFITVSFIISSVCFLVDEKMVLNKNIGVKLIFLTNSIYFSVQAYFAYILKNFMSSGLDNIVLSKNIILERVWTFEEKTAYLKSIVDISSLTHSERLTIIVESRSLSLIKESLNKLLEEKARIIDPIVSIKDQAADNYDYLTISLVFLGLVTVAAIIYYYYGKGTGPTSPPSPPTSTDIPPDLPVVFEGKGVASELSSLDLAWDTQGIVLEKMKLYYGFDSQRKILNATLPQHEDFVPIDNVDLALNSESISLIRKTFTNFRHYYDVGDPTAISRIFDFDNQSLNTISAPMNFFIQALPLDVISFSQKVSIFMTWLAIHRNECAPLFGAVILFGYKIYLENEGPRLVIDSNNNNEIPDPLDFNFLNDHGVLRFLDLLSHDIEKESSIFSEETLFNVISPISFDMFYVRLRDVIKIFQITVENSCELKSMYPDMFYLGIYKLYVFLYTQLRYFSDVAENNPDNLSIIKTYKVLIAGIREYCPYLFQIFNDSNFYIFG